MAEHTASERMQFSCHHGWIEPLSLQPRGVGVGIP